MKEALKIVSGFIGVHSLIRRVKVDIDEEMKEQYLTSARWCGNVYK